MAKLVACIVLVYLSACCNILNADENYDNNVSEATQKQPYKSPEPCGSVYLAEHFDDKERFKNTWVLSEAKKDDIDEDIAKYDGIWSIEELKTHAENGDLGLVLKSKARHAAISTLLTKPFYFKDKPLIVQYEVNFQEEQECGGAYLKLLTLDDKHNDLKQFHDKTPYTIMFGPDKCGNDHKLHFIFRHKNPLNDTITEKHCKKAKDRLEKYFKDKYSHLYTLIIRPDNSYEIQVDNTILNSGSLLDDFAPPVNPPLEIEDPDDKQPDYWDAREKIPDPLAVKPEDWDEDAPVQIVDETDVMPEGWLEDEPLMVPNPDSTKPNDWDDAMDGEWEAPKIPNPKCADAPGCGPYKQKMKKNPRYKGRWLAPLINNPNYKGKWKPRHIHNPEYFNDEVPFKMLPINAIGFELWSMSPDIYFDNIIITDDEKVAKKWSDNTFEIRRIRIIGETWTVWNKIKMFHGRHPWIWIVHALIVAIPIVLLVKYCCFSEDKSELKEEEDKQPFDINDDLAEFANDELQSSIEEFPDQELIIEEVEDKDSGTEEVIESDKDTPLASDEGPRRRKPNKE